MPTPFHAALAHAHHAAQLGHTPAISYLDAIILGLVQGLTEFIPVSSSAHLNITHWLMGSDARQLSFDVMLHVGTLAALAWYFRHDWKEMLFDPAKRRMRNLVIIGCVPAGILGVFLHKVEDLPLFADPRSNAVVLAIAGLVLWASDLAGSKRRPVESIQLPDALIIGCSQAVALIPGVSRSGSTITAGLFLGLDREAAARFSFWMSLPVTIGAAAFEFREAMKSGGLSHLGASPGVIVAGILVSGISGLWSIGFLLNFLRKHDVKLFAIWRIAVAIAVFALIATGLRKPPKAPTAKADTSAMAVKTNG